MTKLFASDGAILERSMAAAPCRVEVPYRYVAGALLITTMLGLFCGCCTLH